MLSDDSVLCLHRIWLVTTFSLRAADWNGFRGPDGTGITAEVTDQRGTTFVFRPNPEGYEEVAVNDLQETCNATCALAGDRVYIRTHRALWCLGRTQ